MSNYRNELVKTIKLMGQELIDRAESMVHDDCDMITNFNINIDIPQPMDGHPELTWSTSAISKNFYDKMSCTAGDMKLEVHAETTTVEKKPNKPALIYIDPFTKTLQVKFDNKNDAEECLTQMTRICNTYGSVDRGDLYNLCAIPDTPHNPNHGWVTTNNMSVVREQAYYILVLPEPIPLE